MANTSKRGFASMDPSKQREIASKGGRAAHAKGTAHEFTSDEARVAGRKGGEAVSRDRAHMSAIGREGGHSRGARARAAAANQGSTSTNPTGTGTQPLVRQVHEERSAFESSANRNTGSSLSSNSYAANDRGNNAPRNDGRSNENRGNNDRSGDGPFSGRGEI